MGSYSKGIEFTVYKGSVDGNAVQSTTRRDKLNGEEVLLKVTHSSLCGTDEHYLRADMCLGHECAGVVEKLGPDVKTLKMYVDPLLIHPLSEIFKSSVSFCIDLADPCSI